MHACIHTYIHSLLTYIHYSHTCICKYVHAYIHAYTQVYKYTYIQQACIHTYIHTLITYVLSLHTHILYIRYITLHYITLHYTTLHYTTLHYTTSHYITLHYIALHYITYGYRHAYALRYIINIQGGANSSEIGFPKALPEHHEPLGSSGAQLSPLPTSLFACRCRGHGQRRMRRFSSKPAGFSRTSNRKGRFRIKCPQTRPMMSFHVRAREFDVRTSMLKCLQLPGISLAAPLDIDIQRQQTKQYSKSAVLLSVASPGRCNHNRRESKPAM